MSGTSSLYGRPETTTRWGQRLNGTGLLLLTMVLASVPATAQVVEYYHLDALGNVRVVTDQNKSVIERHDYLSFGEEWCGSAVCGSVTPGQPRRFTGKERDAETGLDYFGARYYGSKIGRFTTADPYLNIQANLVEPQRWNRYVYVTNNPLRFTDPDGRDKIAEFFLGESGKNINTWEALTGTEARAHYAQTAAEHPVIGGQLGVASLLAPDPTDVAFAPIAARAARLFGKAADEVVDVTISRARSPHAARHIDDAQAAGHPGVVTLDRGRTRPNRRASLEGTKPQKGLDRDEYPPACCGEGGAGASVRPIPRGDNRSAGGQLGAQTRGLPDGTRIRIKTKE